jgi:hypothetical protein
MDDIRVELKKLIGQQVAVDDQTMMTPKIIVGILTDLGDDTYSVEDQDGMALFGWWQVAAIQEKGIRLEGPLNQEEYPESDATYHYDDLDDDDSWP